MDDLFRKEALDARGERMGAPVRPFGPGFIAASALFLALFVSAILYFANASFSRKETVSGWLVPESGEVQVHSLKAGTVSHLLVREGDRVTRGQTLMSLSTDTYTQGESIGKSLLESAADQRILVEAEAAAAKTLAEAREGEIQSRQRSLEHQIDILLRGIGLEEDRLALTEATVSDLSKLREERLVSETQYRQVVLERLSIEQNLLSMRGSLANLRQALEKVRLDVHSSSAQRAGDEARYREALLAVGEKALSARAAAELSIQANATGRITSLYTKVGDVVDMGKTIAVIVPDDSKLVAELWAPSSAIAFVAPGTDVQLMLDAYPYQKFGAVHGSVAQVAQSPTRAQELPAFVQNNEAKYRILVAIPATEVGEELRLVPGMQLQADLILERRSVLEWLLEPLRSMKRHQ